ncbi:MAG: ABC transporter substrate-binding protein [Proteobacteria bacterium]|jgi:ABC-type nitrate/sulfonate/bicarbonate transport systems, periplasmic components|nr:MAG: ABC transporter substrate-binding protein [Pseudomonadota bacterium]
MKYLRKALAGAVLCALAISGPALAEPEKKDVTLGVGGKPALYYLPLTVTEAKGFFKEEGLNVTIQDFQGGSKSLQALMGGSVDVVTGAYEHTIRMQAKGQDLVAVIELGRFPGIVLGVRKDLADKVNSVADLKGLKIGVTAPGSSTHNIVNYALSKAGLSPRDVSIIGVGASSTAVAAMEKGEIDAISNIDPAISMVEKKVGLKVLVDTRSEKDTIDLFGAPSPAAVLYLKPEFAEKYPNTVQALVNAFYKGLQWMANASAEEVAAVVPESYYLGDREMYVQAVANSLPIYSRTGKITEEGMKGAAALLSFDESIDLNKIDLKKTFDSRFIDKVSK